MKKYELSNLDDEKLVDVEIDSSNFKRIKEISIKNHISVDEIISEFIEYAIDIFTNNPDAFFDNINLES